MRILALLGGGLLIAVVLLDAFQSIILPRRPVGRLRITRLFFMATWYPWRRTALAISSRAKRDQFYSIYGPLSLLILFFLWALLLTCGFGMVFFGLRLAFRDPMLVHPTDWARLRSCVYVSGTTLFTLGLGDVLPQSHASRMLTVVEAGTGLGFIALVIGYVPVLYTAFSQREVLVALMDARAGSPPNVIELMLRHNFDGGAKVLRQLLEEWERWCAEMLETHISYPILCYYRSQHDNQSWLSALTTVLDTCALLIATLDGKETRQAQLTFAIGRHTLVDLVHVFHQERAEAALRDQLPARLSDDDLVHMCEALEGTGFSPCAHLEGGANLARLTALRKLYEPSACALAEYLRLELPHWYAPLPEGKRKTDVWRVMQEMQNRGVPEPRFANHVSARATAFHLESHDDD